MEQIIRSNEQLGQIIRMQRKREGLTQLQLAEFCGLSASFISDVEHGKPTVEVGKVLFLLHNLGLDMSIVERSVVS